MGLKCGIVGLPNVGKSTLFNCLSSAKAQAANFPFCTIEPNLGVVQVPDPRLTRLADIVRPERVVPATVEIVDIAGLVRGASRGEGLGNQFLSHIRECTALIHVLRCFENPNIVHVDGNVQPLRDKEVIDTELQLKDLETVEKRLARVEKQAKTGGDKEARRAYEILLEVKKHLEKGQNVRSLDLKPEDRDWLASQQLLTDKPVLYLCNVDEASAKTGNAHSRAVEDMAAAEGAATLTLAVATEESIAQLETYEEKQLFLQELGLEEPGVNRLIRAAYNMLNLQTFFTAGPKEVRAWTIPRGATAPKAAGEIHSDFEKGFIRAEVIKFEDFVRFGSESACRENGKLSIEGKDYIVEDGDIIHFRFNV
ncbi:MAG: redox-regulated ATPase YchF [Flavobacteriales bacterium]|nr:redox-regulated ATPase YchF [Flavobacteriales bacterium]